MWALSTSAAWKANTTLVFSQHTSKFDPHFLTPPDTKMGDILYKTPAWETPELFWNNVWCPASRWLQGKRPDGRIKYCVWLVIRDMVLSPEATNRIVLMYYKPVSGGWNTLGWPLSSALPWGLGVGWQEKMGVERTPHPAGWWSTRGILDSEIGQCLWQMWPRFDPDIGGTRCANKAAISGCVHPHRTYLSLNRAKRVNTSKHFYVFKIKKEFVFTK